VKKPIKIMLLLILVIILLSAAGVGAFFYLQSAKTAKGKPAVLTPYERRQLQVDIPSITTNAGDESSLIQLGITLQASDSSTKNELTDLLPEIQDEILRTVHQFSTQQLRSPDGQRLLASRIQTGVNHLLTSGSVTDVLFTQWIVQ
jgi:flagellar protein FliL